MLGVTYHQDKRSHKRDNQSRKLATPFVAIYEPSSGEGGEFSRA